LRGNEHTESGINTQRKKKLWAINPQSKSEKILTERDENQRGEPKEKIEHRGIVGEAEEVRRFKCLRRAREVREFPADISKDAFLGFA
jgi:hypothetical protein